jgi:sucrose phosphorylase
MTEIESHLRFLYGDAVAHALYPEVQERVRNSKRPGVPTDRSGLRLTERDALLITYGDQVKQAGELPLRTLGAFFKQHVSDVVSGVHLLPFYPYSSDDGFAVKDFFSVDPALGNWADIKNIGLSFDLMFDGVFNHMSARSDWFDRFQRGDPEFRDFFATVDGSPDLSQVVRPRALPLLTEFDTARGKEKVWTTFSADQVDLNFKNPRVLLAVLDVLLFYVAQGARFIRLDAIAYLWKEIGTPCIHLPQTHHVIQFFRAVLDLVAPDALLITETNVPHADNISYFGNGTNEAQLVYNFALPPLVLHTLASGNAEALTRWAANLRLPTDKVTFFNFLASHDGIGVNPARGILTQAEIDGLVKRAQVHGGYVSWKNNSDGSKSPYELNINYFDALSNPKGDSESIERQVDRFMVAQAIMLSLQGMPGIYFHSLFGSRGDRAGAEASGIPRRINRQKLTRTELEGELRDAESLRAFLFGRFKHLLGVRQNEPAFSPTAEQRILELDRRTFALLRQPAQGGALLCVHNVTNEAVEVSVPADGAREWRGLFNKNKAYMTEGTHTKIRLAPYEVLWARQE